MNLDEIRSKINHIDYEIVKLIHERMEFSLKTIRLKPHITDKERECLVLENIKSFSAGLVSEEFAHSLFIIIIEESKHLQEKGYRLIGFQGEHGAHSEIAARKYDPELVPIPCREFNEVFEGIKKRNFDFGILPVENSIEGSISEVNDLLTANNSIIVGEVNLSVNHCLLTLPETDYREIRTVYSHPQALAQCRGFLARNNLEPRPFYDTAGAARMISSQKTRATAAIASPACEKFYNLKLLKENIQDEKTNRTRFLVLSAEKGAKPGNKCSIIFSVKDQAGTLCDILKIFSGLAINLTRIESRPQKARPGHYIFLADFQGSDSDEKIKKALSEVEEKAKFYKFLGCYREEAT